MPNEPVFHEMILLKLGELQGESKERTAQMGEMRGAIVEIKDRLTNGEVRFVGFDRHVLDTQRVLGEIKQTIEKAMEHGNLRHEVQDARIKLLEHAETIRKAELGFLKRITESKLFIWLLGVLGAAGAWLLGANHGGGS